MHDSSNMTLQTLALVVTSVTLGLSPIHASAESVTGWSGCTGQPIQIGTGADPEKDTVGIICLSKDVDVTGSTVIRAQDGKWTIAPVGQTTGNPERDTVGYVRQ